MHYEIDEGIYQWSKNEVGVRVAMRPFLTIGKYLPSPKDPISDNEISGLVCQVS